MWLVKGTRKIAVECFYCSVASSCTPVTVPRSSQSFLPVSPSVEEMRTFYNEVAILKKLSRKGNPHVITMVGYIARENPPAIVMEFAPLGSLRDFLVKVKEEVRSCMSNECLLVCSIQSYFGPLMQRVAVLHPHAVAMPPPIQVPEELREYYASLTLEPRDVLSFAYQIASGMVSRENVRLLS